MQAAKENARGGNHGHPRTDGPQRQADYNPYERITPKEKLMAWVLLYGWVLLMAVLDWSNNGFRMPGAW